MVFRFVYWIMKDILKFKMDYVVIIDTYYEWWVSNVMNL